MFFVRTANDRDIEPLRALLTQSFHATYDRFYGPAKVEELISAWHNQAEIKRRIHLKGGEYLVADDGKRIGGMAFAAMSDKLTKTAILHQLYVHPDQQRQGIGRDLFAEIETCFPDAEILRLEVEPQNEGAIAFYTAHDFAEVDRTRNCGGPDSGIEALIMEKSLR
ncbi:GNAT family N-acetyltransferase [Peteryoungia ipomoeae]|uniref:GNAT family N-acetyltransferase n=1 Tax=Peteryoungia ipomoeae TaxID=1210932 RepID=A0A4S8PBG4_9HYPH|nr:GNAT family N-acetyltransferase [Peteryoungia ipomoeae]THV25524.1 GNAT family N-acetyltransferase [Peteryoungia ipomoeae]